MSPSLALAILLAAPATAPKPKPKPATAAIEYPFAGPRSTHGQAAATGNDATTSSDTPKAPPPNPDRKAKTKRILGIGLMATGGAATLAGVGVLVAGVVGENRASDNLARDLAAQDEANCPIGSNTGSCGDLERNIATWRSDQDTAERNVTIGGAVLGVGLAITLAGGIVYAIGRYGKPRRATARVVLEPRGFGLAGRF